MESRVPVRVLSSRQSRLVKVAPRLKDVSIMGGKNICFSPHLHLALARARAHSTASKRFYNMQMHSEVKTSPPSQTQSLFVCPPEASDEANLLFAQRLRAHTQTPSPFHLVWDCAHTSFNAARLKHYTGDASEKNTVFVFCFFSKMTSNVFGLSE